MQYSQAIGRYWAEMARYMADSLILPLNVTRYGETLAKYVHDLDDGYGAIMKQNNATTGERYDQYSFPSKPLIS